ncbi:putative ribonuclease H-like domain-containing protein [Tanacetum coccineum]
MELHDVSYGIEYVARPLLLFFSSENQLLWFRYREYDLAHLKLVFEFSIYKVWKSVGYGRIESSGYGVLIFNLLWSLSKDENGVETEVPPKTAQALLQRQKERKAKSALLLAIPDEYQLSSKDKTGLRYGDQLNENGSSGSELFNSVFGSRSSDEDDNQQKDSFKKDKNIMLTANKTSASVSHVETSNTPLSNTSVEIPRVESVRPSGVIIEDWVSDDKEDMFQSKDSQTTDGHSISQVLNTRVSKEKVNTVRVNDVNTVGQTTVSTVKGNGVTAVKASASCVWRPKKTDLNNGSKDNSGSRISKRGNLQQALKDKGMFDSGCSRHMTRNKALFTDYQDIDGAFVAFGGNTRGGKITVTDDFSRFSWVFFLATKSETSGILKKFITEIENQLNHKVKVIRSDNGTEFKNREMDEFCGQKGIKREYSVARTPQQRNQTNKNAQETNGNTAQSSDDKAKDYTVDDDACRKIAHEPTSEYDQALKNILDKMMDQEKEAT